MSKWKTTRIIVISASFVSALFSPSHEETLSAFGWDALVICFLSFPLIGLLGLLISFVFPQIIKRIARPNWDKNPFDFSAPEQLFHLAGYATIATGWGIIIRCLYNQIAIAPVHFAPVALGLGVLIGLRILTSTYKSSGNASI